MDYQIFKRVFLDPGLSLLPARMDTPQARAMITSICLQESRIVHRRQIGGPARGFAQFEVAGVSGVMTHRVSSGWCEQIVGLLGYRMEARELHAALEHNDPLCCVFSRLLLWTLPEPLPERGEVDKAWRQYTDAWRPGKPHRSTWGGHYRQAWEWVADTPYLDGVGAGGDAG